MQLYVLANHAVVVLCLEEKTKKLIKFSAFANKAGEVF